MQTADLIHSITACWPKLAIPCGQWLSQRLHLAEEVVIEGRRLQILEQVCVTSAVADISGLWDSEPVTALCQSASFTLTFQRAVD